MELSFEQQFSMRCFADQVQHMSLEQAQEFLLMLYRQMMIKDTMYQNFLKHEWKLDSGAIAHLSKEANREGL